MARVRLPQRAPSGNAQPIPAEPISGPEKGVITKGVFSLEESLESLKSLDSPDSLENGRILLCFHSLGVL